MNVALYLFAGYLCFGALAMISQIGKPRKPTTHGQAIVLLILTAAEVAVLIAAARRFG